LVDLGQSAVFSAADPGNSGLSFSWQLTSTPSGSELSTDSHEKSVTLTPDKGGDYIVRLTVTSAQNLSSSADYTFTAGTILSSDFTISANSSWIPDHSPYILPNSGKTTIAAGVTLTVMPGVTVRSSVPWSESRFEILGAMVAVGTSQEQVTFIDQNLMPKGDQFDRIDLEYAKLVRGWLMQPTGNAVPGNLTLKNSRLEQVNAGGSWPYAYIWYPSREVVIEKNIFDRSGGLSVGTSSPNVIIRNNVFYQTANATSCESCDEGPVTSWAAFNGAQVIVERNSFLSTDRVAMTLPPGYTSTSISASENFFNTTDPAVIDSMIFDQNDDPTCAGTISTSHLSAPSPQTPSFSPAQ